MQNLTSKTYYKTFDKSTSELTHIYIPHDELSYEFAKKNRDFVQNYFQAKNLILLRQEHKDKVHFIKHDSGEDLSGDALVTDEPKIAIAIQTADCVCALLASVDNKAIGVLHLGWKGARSNLVDNTIKLMRSISKQEIFAAISPCIRKQSYEVDKDFYENFISQRPDSKNFFEFTQNILTFDLPEYVKYTLKLNNINNIVDKEVDTYREQNKYFSYRSSVKNNLNLPQRMLSVIMIKEDQ